MTPHGVVGSARSRTEGARTRRRGRACASHGSACGVLWRPGGRMSIAPCAIDTICWDRHYTARVSFGGASGTRSGEMATGESNSYAHFSFGSSLCAHAFNVQRSASAPMSLPWDYSTQVGSVFRLLSQVSGAANVLFVRVKCLIILLDPRRSSSAFVTDELTFNYKPRRSRGAQLSKVIYAGG
ncbi:hypothetical protein EDB86DRAFT_2925209 [Lactarius hatsudake]|nr:hypothetical protein EDB86DRAFT_2925209 [Lactarius hatsudake]